VVVASGYNMTVLSDFFLAITAMFSLPLSVSFTVAGLFCYAVLLGLEPPVLRALIMVSFTMLGMLLGRRKSPLRALLFSGCLLLFIKPRLLNSISFQLSFTATLGLVVLATPLKEFLSIILDSIGKLLPQTKKISLFNFLQIADSLSSTVAATLFVFPILAYYFGNFSFISFAANTFLLWSTPATMFLGIFAVIALPFSKVLFRLLLWCTWPFLKIFNLGAQLFAKIPLKINFKFTRVSVFVYYIILFALCAGFLNFLAVKKNAKA
jgi:competence protein ComEC